MITTGAGRIAGIIGFPVSHSLSPQLHNYWLQDLGIDGAYVPLAVRPGDLEIAIKTLPSIGFCGANVTIPHKEVALRCVNIVDPVAQRIGAVNTVVMIEQGTQSLGLNTDGYGFLASLDDVDSTWRSVVSDVVILGAGGAARAIIVALLDVGISHLSVINRSVERANRLSAELSSTSHTLHVWPWQHRNRVIKDTDLLINTTPLGMEGQEPLGIDVTILPDHALVVDIVYRPLVTDLLSQARRRRLKTVDGLGMLIHQAVPGFEAWFGKRPHVTATVRRQMETILSA